MSSCSTQCCARLPLAFWALLALAARADPGAAAKASDTGCQVGDLSEEAEAEELRALDFSLMQRGLQLQRDRGGGEGAQAAPAAPAAAEPAPGAPPTAALAAVAPPQAPEAAGYSPPPAPPLVSPVWRSLVVVGVLLSGVLALLCGSLAAHKREDSRAALGGPAGPGLDGWAAHRGPHEACSLPLAAPRKTALVGLAAHATVVIMVNTFSWPIYFCLKASLGIGYLWPWWITVGTSTCLAFHLVNVLPVVAGGQSCFLWNIVLVGNLLVCTSTLWVVYWLVMCLDEHGEPLWPIWINMLASAGTLYLSVVSTCISCICNCCGRV